MHHPTSPLRRAAFLVPLLAMSVVIFGAYFFHETLTQMSGPPWNHAPIDPNHVKIEPEVEAAYLATQADTTDSARAAQSSIQVRANRLSQRISWGASLAVYAAVCGTVIVAAAFIIFVSLDGFDRWTRVAATVLIPTANLLLIAPLLATTLPRSVMTQILLQTVGTDSQDIGAIFQSVDALTLATALNLTAACCGVLAYPKGDTPIDARYMTRMIKLMRLTLYAGTASLVVAIVEKSALAHWAISYVPDTAAQQAFESLTTSLITARGAYYSMALLAIYLPTTLILRDLAESILKQPPRPDEDPYYRTWLETNGLSTTLSELLPKAVAILGPFLAGPIAEAVKRILNQ
jgi:hypothetical protein